MARCVFVGTVTLKAQLIVKESLTEVPTLGLIRQRPESWCQVESRAISEFSNNSIDIAKGFATLPLAKPFADVNVAPACDGPAPFRRYYNARIGLFSANGRRA